MMTDHGVDSSAPRFSRPPFSISQQEFHAPCWMDAGGLGSPHALTAIQLSLSGAARHHE